MITYMVLGKEYSLTVVGKVVYAKVMPHLLLADFHKRGYTVVIR